MLHELVSLPATFTTEALEELAIERTSVLEVSSNPYAIMLLHGFKGTTNGCCRW